MSRRLSSPTFGQKVGLLIVPLLWFPCVAPSVASAQNVVGEFLGALGDLFEGPKVVPAQVRRVRGGLDLIAIPDGNIKVGIDFANVYTPFLKKVMTAELHFVKKVCAPTDEQFDAIHRAGRMAVAVTSKRYENLQQSRQSARSWPKPREEICKALQIAIDESLSPEVANSYRQEIAGRLQAGHEASRGMMLVLIDESAMLTPQQHRDIGETLDKKWDDTWTTGAMLLMYPQYARMPSAGVLREHLTPRQKTVWAAARTDMHVNFGWQTELGMQNWFGGGTELPDFKVPKDDEAQTALPIDAGANAGGLDVVEIEVEMAAEAVEVVEVEQAEEAESAEQK